MCGAEKGVSGARAFSLPARKVPKSQCKSRIIKIETRRVRIRMMMVWKS